MVTMKYNSSKHGLIEVNEMPVPHLRNALSKLQRIVFKSSDDHEMIGAMKQILGENKYSIGHIVLIVSKKYLICSPMQGFACLISLEGISKGNRWKSAVSVEDNQAITVDEMNKMLGSDKMYAVGSHAVVFA